MSLLRTILWGSVLVTVTAVPRQVVATSGHPFVVPRNPTRAIHGLQLHVDPTWIDASGYRPVRIKLSTVPYVPSPVDRRLRIELRPNDWHGRRWKQAVSTYVELPRGSREAEVTVGLPQNNNLNYLSVNAYEDGRELTELSHNEGFSNNSSQFWSEAAPAVLVIARGAPTLAERRKLVDGTMSPEDSQALAGKHRLPDVRVLTQVLPTGEEEERSNQPGVLGLLRDVHRMPNLDLLPPRSVPQRWIELTCFDVIMIEMDDAVWMSEQKPVQWKSLRHWVATGPTLCIYGVGGEFERLAALEHLLELQPLSAADAEDGKTRSWRTPNQRKYGDQVPAMQEIQQALRERYVQSVDEAEESEASPPPERWSAAQSPPFVWRDVNLGRAVAIGPSDPFDGDPRTWRWLFNSLNSRDWMWYQRHGFSLRRENRDFWNFLVPGVGQAPINAFCVLISLFALVIGPVNYFLLRRWRRLHLLLITIPGGALLVTSALLAWALWSDGLSTRVRVRSYTEIDQQQGRAVSWSRQSYYAALTPSGGLSFPRDVAVYPFELVPYLSSQHHGGRRWRERIVLDNRQRLQSGFMRSRVPAQFFVASARHSRAGLRIMAPAESGPPSVVNEFDAHIQMVWIHGVGNDHFFAEDVASGATFTPEAGELPQLIEQFRVVSRDNRPAFPEGFDEYAYQGALSMHRGWFSGYGWYYGADSAMSQPSSQTGIMESKLNRIGALDRDGIAPRTYVAVVDQSPEVPLGLESVRQVSSFHVVVGHW